MREFEHEFLPASIDAAQSERGGEGQEHPRQIQRDDGNERVGEKRR